MTLRIIFLIALTISPVLCPPTESGYSEPSIGHTLNLFVDMRIAKIDDSETTTTPAITDDYNYLYDYDILDDIFIDHDYNKYKDVTMATTATTDITNYLVETSQTIDIRKCNWQFGKDGFACDNGNCIPDDYMCDGHDNCRDDSDESQSVCGWQTCPYNHNMTTTVLSIAQGDCRYCGSNQWRCDNGKCISDLCDGHDECGDNSDESQSVCGWQTCPHDHNISTTAFSIAQGDCRYCRADTGGDVTTEHNAFTKKKFLTGRQIARTSLMSWKAVATLPAFLSLTTPFLSIKLLTCVTLGTNMRGTTDGMIKVDFFVPVTKLFHPVQLDFINYAMDRLTVLLALMNTIVTGCISLVMVTTVALLWFLLYKIKVAKPDFMVTSKTNANMAIVNEFVKEVFSLINSSGEIYQSTKLREKYSKIRKSGNSLKNLFKSLSYTFIEPKSCHEISKLIINLEMPFQRNKRKRCMFFFRKFLESNSETEKFISFLKEPGYLQDLQCILTKFSDNAKSNSCTGFLLKVVKVVLASSFFFFDILRDISLYLLLQQYLNNNSSSAPIEVFLVHLSLGCLVLSHTVIGIQCLLNWPQMFQSTAGYSSCKRGFIFLVLLIISPLLPTIVAMNGVCVSLDKDTFIAQYRKNPNNMNISTLINKIDVYDSYLSVNAKNHAYIRIIESMLEASPQVLVITLLAIWQFATGSTNGAIDLLVQSENRKSLILFALSVPSSMITIMLSVAKFANTFKQGSIGLKGSFIICTGYFFLFLGKICSLMTILSPCFIAYNSITQHNIIEHSNVNYDVITVLNVTNLRIPSSPLLPNYSWVPDYLRYSLMSLVHPFLPVALPVILMSLLSHVVFVFIYCHKHVPDFRTAPILDRVFHCLANLLVPIPFHSFTETPQRRRWKEYRAYVLSSLTTSVLIFMGFVLARQSAPFKVVVHDKLYEDDYNASYLSVLYTTLHYQSSHKADQTLVNDNLVPYDHPHILIFTLLYNYHEPIARFLNVIFHLPWLLMIFFLHGLGLFVLSFYYRRVHLWSSLALGSSNRQHTAEELLELIEGGNYEDEEEEDDEEGSCLMLVNCFSHCKDRLNKVGETICSSWSLERCQCRDKCRRQGKQEDVVLIRMNSIPNEDFNITKENSASKICSKIVEEIIISSLLSKQESQGDSENIESEKSITRVDVHREQEEFQNELEEMTHL